MADCRGTNFNLIVLSFAFMFIFIAFQTCSMIQKIVLESAKKEMNGTDVGDGFISLSIISVIYAFATWLTPAIVAVLGAKVAMIVAGSTYLLYTAMFLRPRAWSLYLCSSILGVTSAVMWTAQGNFLTLNSNANTMGRKSGIFWAIFQCSLLFGNLYVFFALRGVSIITDVERTQLFIILTAVCAIGTILLCFLRTIKTPYEVLGDLQVDNTEIQEEQSSGTKAWIATKMSFHLMKTREMILLSFTFMYTGKCTFAFIFAGIEYTMFSGVFVTAVGHSTQFGNQAKSYLGLCGALIGVGEITGGSLFGLFGKRTVKYGRNLIVFIAFVAHITACYIMFLFLSECSPLEYCDDDTTYFPASEYAIFATAFLLGLGDSIFNTQLFPLLGFLYPYDSASAFALFNFFQSLASAAAFYYGTVLLLQWQLLIMTVFCFIGTLTFFAVEWRLPAQ